MNGFPLLVQFDAWDLRGKVSINLGELAAVEEKTERRPESCHGFAPLSVITMRCGAEFRVCGHVSDRLRRIAEGDTR